MYRVLLATLGVVGCGDVCGKAQRIGEDCEWYDDAIDVDPFDCEGAYETRSQCIVDNPDTYCGYYQAYLDDPSQDLGSTPFAQCLADQPAEQ